MKHLRYLIFFSILCHECCAGDIKTDTVTFGKFGRVFIYRPDVAKELVLFVSGDGGWRYGVVDMARALADQGAIVAGINILRYWKNIENTTDECVYPSGDIENLSQFLQKKYKFEAYQEPILSGYSSGATLIYGLMAQAPEGTYKGGIALGFCPDIISKKPLCEGSGLHYTSLPQGKGYEFLPSKNLTTPFAVLIGELDHLCDVEHTSAFMKNIPGEIIYRLPNVGHGFSKTKDWMPQFLKAYTDIVDSNEKLTAPINLRDLPVTEISSDQKYSDQPVLVSISGDGGWKGFVQQLGKDFTGQGIPVAGIDALRYFWNLKTPDQTTSDVSAIIRFYLKKWNRRSFVLLGYSFGANVMPFVVNRLPEDLRAKLKMVVLLSPGTQAEFEFHFSSWLNRPYSGDFPLLPELKKMKDIQTVVFYGKEEDQKLTIPLVSKSIKIILVPGDHHYHYQHAVMAQAIQRELNHGNSPIQLN